MTTSQEKAAEIINGHCCSYCDYFGAEQAQALADAGLLAGEYVELAPKPGEADDGAAQCTDCMVAFDGDGYPDCPDCGSANTQWAPEP